MNPNLQPHDPDHIRRLTLAMFMLGAGLLAWHYIYEYPRQMEAQRLASEKAQVEQESKALLEQKQRGERIVAHDQALKQAAAQPLLPISSPEVEGSLGLRGARLQYLILKQYAQEAKPESPPVELLRPGGAPESYFIEFGWLSQDSKTRLPDNQTLWQTEAGALTPDSPAILFWENGEGLRFEIHLRFEGEYLFGIEQRVSNQGDTEATLLPYGYINRTMPQGIAENMILHEGPLGVLDGTLSEIGYADLTEEREIAYPQATGWLGISDKYWLTALIPPAGQHFAAHFKAYEGKNATTRFQADFLGQPQQLRPGETSRYESLVFAGAKKLRLLDGYAQQHAIPLFDRAVDLGFLYFLTKPLFTLLHWLYTVAGDFGLAILLLTVLVKMAMYPLANKSYVSMNEMKRLQPKLAQLKERCGDDKLKFNQEMMKLYKQEKINPAAGCLPLLVQMPVFFALYKVLFVTIEMRHAPFYGLLRDLSAPDPTNLFTLFGLLEWTPPSLLHLGILPIFFALSMWAQQQMNPKPTDPAQAKVMSWLPWIFMVILAGFPAGLLIYWVWSNLISIAQQWSIKKRFEKRQKRREKASATG